jgi:CDP-6-deoxy-D-xylo-4-hexulose-3-dehydrase
VAGKHKGVFNVVGPELLARSDFAASVLKELALDNTGGSVVAMSTEELGQAAVRPLKAGLVTSKLAKALPAFKMRNAAAALKDWNPALSSYYGETQLTRASSAKKAWYAPHTFEAYGEEEIAAVEKCLRAGWLAPGPRTAEFERQVSAWFGKKNGVMVNSGSSANMTGLAVLDLPKGSEIITPACTFSTCIAPMEQLGLIPVFCDVELGSYVPTVDAILACITDKTSCCFIPNLIGSKIDWQDLRNRLPRQDIILFEDSCDTMTHTPASDVACISFYASHIITAGGCGGMVMFNNPEYHARALMFRDWGRIGNNSEDVSDRFGHTVDGIPYDFKFLYGVLGYNFKCCEMNAAFGLVQMAKLPKFRQMRKDNINRYVENLKKANTSYILPTDHNEHDWLACPFTMHEKHGNDQGRMNLLTYLEDNDVQTRVCFAGNITRHPAYRKYLKAYPNSDIIMARSFLLGAHHGLTFADIDRVSELLIRWDKGGVAPVKQIKMKECTEADTVF